MIDFFIFIYRDEEFLGVLNQIIETFKIDGNCKSSVAIGMDTR